VRAFKDKLQTVIDVVNAVPDDEVIALGAAHVFDRTIAHIWTPELIMSKLPDLTAGSGATFYAGKDLSADLPNGFSIAETHSTIGAMRLALKTVLALDILFRERA